MQVSRIDAKSRTEDLIYLMNSPLFLYAIGPRMRLANDLLHKSLQEASPESTTIEARHLRIVVGHDASCCFTQLRYGASVLIDTREPNIADQKEADRISQHRRILQWFCDEVEFLSYEYSAREEAAASILGHRLMKNVRSKFVKLKVGKDKTIASRKKRCYCVQEERWIKFKPRLEKRRQRVKHTSGALPPISVCD